MKEYSVLAPNGYLHGPFTWKDVQEFAADCRSSGVCKVLRMKPVAKISSEPKLEML